jgi:phosphatidylethanolamine-binding protein (PEBP) family uncharacterized protein
MAAERGRGDSIILSLVADFALQSSAFDHGGPIPRRHNCEGEHLSPPLAWSGAPEGTRSLALVVDDPDARAGTFTHWLAWALDPGATGLGEGEAAPVEGHNDFGTNGYRGPCSPPATAATATASASTARLRSLSAARLRQERPATLPRCASEAGLTALRRSGVRRRSAARRSGLDRRRSPRLLRRRPLRRMAVARGRQRLGRPRDRAEREPVTHSPCVVDQVRCARPRQLPAQPAGVGVDGARLPDYAALSLDAATDQQNLLALRGKDPRPALRTLSEREGPQLCEYGP